MISIVITTDVGLRIRRLVPSKVKCVAYACVLFGREEFESEYQDKLAEYEAELKEWKKEAKRRVTV